MSRSYKKFPVCKDYNRGSKAIANRNIRRKLRSDEESYSKSSIHRKMYPSYDISDYRFIMSLKDELESYREEIANGDKYGIKKRYPNEKSVIRWWKKTYLGK